MPDLNGSGSVPSTLLDLARTNEVRSTLEGRFSDYCHACSNRLNSLKLSLYLAQRQPSGRSDRLLRAAHQCYQTLEQQFDLFRAVCRPLKLSPVRLDLALLIDDRRAAWTKVLAGQGVQLVLEPPGRSVDVWIDPDRLGQALDAMVDWRARASRPGVVVTLGWGFEAESSGTTFASFSWREFAPRPGRSNAPQVDAVATWALPLLTRVVAEHGGSVSCWDDRGWQVQCLWPTEGLPSSS